MILGPFGSAYAPYLLTMDRADVYATSKRDERFFRTEQTAEAGVLDALFPRLIVVPRAEWEGAMNAARPQFLDDR